MDVSELDENHVPSAPLDDSVAGSAQEVETQMGSSIPMISELIPERAAPGQTRQVLQFDLSHSESTFDANESIIDLEVTTQVLDTLDALDMVEYAENAGKEGNTEVDSSEPQKVPLSPSHNDTKRVLPAWMTEAPPPVVTRRSLFLNTQSRHRKKQFLVDDDENIESPASKYSYTDILRPSEMNLARVICFDVESTGFASTDGIIEIGAVEYIYGQRTGAMFQSYIKPSVPVNPHAADVHGLTNMMLASAPGAHIIIPSFLAWVGSSPLVAHNARFDMRMCVILHESTFTFYSMRWPKTNIYFKMAERLQQEADRLGIGNSLKGKDVFCTMRCYRKLFPERPYSLIDTYTGLLGAERYASNSQICNPKLPNHSAIVDCEILGEIFLKMAEEALSQCVPLDFLKSSSVV